MPQQLETREQDFSQRVITALTHLAALSRRTSTLRAAPPETLNQIATTLIHRLATLCGAQRGALLLARHTPHQDAATLQGAFAGQPLFSLIAGVQMSEEEARAVLATYSLVAAPPHWSLDLPPTLVWRRTFDAPETHIPSSHSPASHLALHSYALLLLVWPETPPRTREHSLRERELAIQLLPFLGDTVDAILLHVLLASGEKERPEEPLPAELLATVGHEFRGPLTTISGYASTLLSHDQQLAPEERQDFLRAISEAGTRLGKLVDRFLELAQFEMDTVAFAPTSVDLAALAHEAITAAKQTRSHLLVLPPQTSRARSSGEGAEETHAIDELTILGDRRWLRTMLDILLENAIAYSPAESMIEVLIEATDPAHLHAVLGTHSDPGTHMALILPGAFGAHEALLEIQVRDHGIGIAPEHLARIFQRFSRVDTRLTREVNGLGLGLALCKAIVAQHRGALWVESTLEEGSTFHIVLPREEAPTGHIL